MDLSVVPYGAAYGGAVAKYGECMRNHAAAMGGQAYDGCGEFMPGGDGGSLEALKCAACGCHRNFHRREGPAGPPRRPLALLPPPPLGFPAAFLPQPVPCQQIGPLMAYGRSRAGSETPPRRGEEEEEGRRLQVADSAARSTKRHRTKFTAEQKKKMQAFAERLGWRICKHDDVALREFCLEVGVKRNVLKVWMHNNKNSNSTSAAAAAAKHDGVGAGATAQPISV